MDGVIKVGLTETHQHSKYVYNFFPVLRIFQSAQRLKETKTETKGRQKLTFQIYPTTTYFLHSFQKHAQTPAAAPDFTKFAKIRQNNYFIQRNGHQGESLKHSHELWSHLWLRQQAG